MKLPIFRYAFLFEDDFEAKLLTAITNIATVSRGVDMFF
jgi:hypothetical protein